MRAYEIHTFRDGQWKVDSVFDDRELAIHEARKVDANGRYAGVRVIEENYDETSDLTTTRTIFRGKKEAAKAKQRLEITRKNGHKGHRNGGEREHNGKRRASPQKSNSSSPLVLVLILLLILMTGVTVLFGLHYVSSLS